MDCMVSLKYLYEIVEIMNEENQILITYKLFKKHVKDHVKI